MDRGKARAGSQGPGRLEVQRCVEIKPRERRFEEEEREVRRTARNPMTQNWTEPRRKQRVAKPSQVLAGRKSRHPQPRDWSRRNTTPSTSSYRREFARHCGARNPLDHSQAGSPLRASRACALRTFRHCSTPSRSFALPQPHTVSTTVKPPTGTPTRPFFFPER